MKQQKTWRRGFISTALAMVWITGFLLMLLGGAETAAGSGNGPYQLGAPQVREIQVSLVLSNTGEDPVRDVQITLPLATPSDSPYQRLLSESFSVEPEEISPAPAGGRTAVIRPGALDPGEEKVVRVDYVMVSYPIQFSPGSGSNVGGSGSVEEFRSPAAKIESDHAEIKSAARELKVRGEDDMQTARRYYDFVLSHVEYDSRSPYRNRGALAALQQGEGVCEDMASLFVALSRASGIPSRIVNGYVDPSITGSRWDISKGQELSLQGLRHSWAEFYEEEYGWVPVDPTYGQVIGADTYFSQLPHPSHIMQNYGDRSLRVAYQGGRLSARWQENMVSQARMQLSVTEGN